MFDSNNTEEVELDNRLNKPMNLAAHICALTGISIWNYSLVKTALDVLYNNMAVYTSLVSNTDVVLMHISIVLLLVSAVSFMADYNDMIEESDKE